MEVCAVLLLDDVVSGVNEAKSHMSTKTFGTLIPQALLVCSTVPWQLKEEVRRKGMGYPLATILQLTVGLCRLAFLPFKLTIKTKDLNLLTLYIKSSICCHLDSYIYTSCRSCNYLHVQSDVCAGSITAIPFSSPTRPFTYRLRTSIP